MLELREVFSQTADAVFAIDNGCRVVYGNKAFARICNCSLADMAGRPCHEMLRGHTLNGDSFCHAACTIGKSLLQQQVVENFDLAIPQPNGEAVWVNVGALVAPPAWLPASVVFTLRSVSIFKVLTRFANAGQQSRPLYPCKLTNRERQILKLLLNGLDTHAISDKLNISHATVRNHLRNTYEKLGVHNRAEALSYAYRNGLL